MDVHELSEERKLVCDEAVVNRHGLEFETMKT